MLPTTECPVNVLMILGVWMSKHKKDNGEREQTFRRELPHVFDVPSASSQFETFERRWNASFLGLKTFLETNKRLP